MSNQKEHIREQVASIRRLAEADPDGRAIYEKITDIRVERLQDISEEDALEEGADYQKLPSNGLDPAKARTWFRGLWEAMSGAGSWSENPWVWVISFKRI